VADLEIGPDGGAAELDQLDAIREGTDGSQPAYLGGQVDLDGVDADGAWVVAVVDGVVRGFSRLFPMLDTDTAFSVLVDQDVVGDGAHAIDLYVIESSTGPLLPLDLR